jgi:hypothetical protein
VAYRKHNDHVPLNIEDYPEVADAEPPLPEPSVHKRFGEAESLAWESQKSSFLRILR